MKTMNVFAAVAAAALLFAGSAAKAQTNNPDLHLTMGNPSNATTSTSNYNNYLMKKNQYALSYARDYGIPNWVSWHLESQDMGSAARSDTFTTDTTLPSGWYRVTTNDYTGSGYDRGHNCPSADRTLSTTDNKATFLMTNIMPQAPDNNQGPWAKFEDYCRSLVSQGNELYIISVNTGEAKKIASNKVSVPSYVSKVVLVLPKGSNDLSRVTTSTRVIAIDMPNVQGIRNADWRSYRVSVDQIESWSGFNLLSALPDNIENVIEARVDNQ